MRPNFLTSSLEDIEAIREYLAGFSTIAAQHFVDAVFARVEQLENFPELGRIVPERQDPAVRELLYRKYRIIYRLREAGRIDIITVQSSSRPLNLPL